LLGLIGGRHSSVFYLSFDWATGSFNLFPPTTLQHKQAG